MKFKMLVEDIEMDHVSKSVLPLTSRNGDIAGGSWRLKITLSDDEGKMASPVNDHLYLPNE